MWRERLQALRERPFIGLLASIVIHLGVIAALLLLGGPFAKVQVKRGEPLFVELPNIPEPAPAGNPPATSAGPPPPPAPPIAAPSAPPAPQGAALPPGAQAPPAPPVDIRSALKRGGGAGGTSNGRGGIEGEPIPLDSPDPRYSDYFDRVRRMIKERWGYPCVKNGDTHECEYKTAALIVEFGIAKDGKVPFVNVLRSSGWAIYDDY